jgi:hypothetical protein
MVAAAQRQSRRGKRESSFLTKLQIAEWRHRQCRRQQQRWHEGTHRERRKKKKKKKLPRCTISKKARESKTGSIFFAKSQI